MMELKISILNETEKKILENSFEPLTILTECNLIHEGQIPNFGIVLLEGKAYLTRKQNIVIQLEPGSIFGVTELLSLQQISYSYQIGVAAKIILINRSELNKIIEKKNSRILNLLLTKTDQTQFFRMLPS